MAGDLKESLCGRHSRTHRKQGGGGGGEAGEEDRSAILCCFAAQEKDLNFSECFRKPLESFRQEKNRALFSFFQTALATLGGTGWEVGDEVWRRLLEAQRPERGGVDGDAAGGGGHPSQHGGSRPRYMWVCYLKIEGQLDSWRLGQWYFSVLWAEYISRSQAPWSIQITWEMVNMKILGFSLSVLIDHQWCGALEPALLKAPAFSWSLSHQL